ncbi:hypothetical protein JYK21_03105 [Ralstonia pickettii]|nr:hypothetical protein [Ralstonia pickettii]
MAIASKLAAIGMIVASIVAGFLSFYIMSNLPKETKKKQIEELTSQFINFILFIWLGKIIVNFSIFIKDPLAILAYPSDSNAFYLAVLFTTILLFYKARRKQLDRQSLLIAFLHIFLVASFSFEFIQLVWNNNHFALGYLILLAILLVLFFSLSGHITTIRLSMALLTLWSLGIMVLSFFQPFVTVFSYNVSPVFAGVFFIICFSGLLLKQRKSDE